jgi:hypothetical protein
MIGQRFTRLLIFKEAPRVGHNPRYWCRCDCGNELIAYWANLRRGATKSCGCLKKETKSKLTHGMSSTPEYKTWAGIKKRCYNKNMREYHLWGGRGIRMSREWRKDFLSFYRDMGPKPSPAHSIERTNNEDGYNSANCVWALPVDQTRNRRGSHHVTYLGRKMHLKAFADELGHSYFSIYAWVVRQGMSAAEAAKKAASCRSEPLPL